MIYLDNAATTPVPAAVADTMYDVLTHHFGNPSSQYPAGQEMKKAVEGWRAVIAGALHCPPERLYFTSCGTEGDNWAIRAACWQNRHTGRHIVTTAVEHHGLHHLPHGLAGLCLEHLPFADRGELLNGTAVRGQDL